MASAASNVTPLKPPKNLALWDVLSKTDPRHTKSFKRAGGFSGTAIRPIWIIQRLTEMFGPVGVGWGMGKPTFELVHASEGVASIGKQRRFIGTELHPIYWRQGVKNLQSAKPEMDDLFASVAV